MPETSQVVLDDYLHQFIGISRLYYEKRAIKFFSDFSVLFSLTYCSLFIHCLVVNIEDIAEKDLLYAALILEVISTKFSLDYQSKNIRILDEIRTDYFWSYQLLNLTEKNSFKKILTVLSPLHSFLWWYILAIITCLKIITYSHGKFIYILEWPYLARCTYKTIFMAATFSGYFVSVAHVSYFLYVTLHVHLQLKILISYLEREFDRFNSMSTQEKIQSWQYQVEIGAVLKRCVNQYRILTKYGNIVVSLYRRTMFCQLLVGVAVMAVLLHTTIYNPQPNAVYITMEVIHFGAGCGAYVIAGELFTQGYADFYSSLCNAEWYTLNEENKKMYYMFLIYAQRKYEIEMIPGITITLSALAKFMKIIYAGVTLLQSMST